MCPQLVQGDLIEENGPTELRQACMAFIVVGGKLLTLPRERLDIDGTFKVSTL